MINPILRIAQEQIRIGNILDLQAWKLLATIVTVIAGLMTVLGPFWISSISEKIAEKDKAELNRNLSDLKRDSSAIQGKLDPFIELAKQKFPSKNQDEALAALKENLNTLQSQTNELSKRLEQRIFSEIQEKAFLNELEKYQKIKVLIENYNSDAESIRFAKQLIDLFKKAGWDVGWRTRLAGSPPKGIILGIKERGSALETYVQGLGGFLKSFGSIHAELSDKIPSSELLILVGTKE